MAEAAKKKKISSMMPDWSQLPEELLHLISKNVEYCFDVVHARSVCRSWRSSFPFPCCLLRPSYSIPAFADFPLESKGLCTFEKVPLFLFRVRAPPLAAALSFEYFLGGISPDESENRIELLQCSMKVKTRGSDPILLNILDCQILPLGYQYRMIGWDPKDWTNGYRGMACLPLNKEGGGGEEFVVLLNYSNSLLVLTSAEMKWKPLRRISHGSCTDVVTCRGRFYATFLNRDIFILDPNSLQHTPLMSSQPLRSRNYLIPFGNDELFLVERFNSFPEAEVIDLNRFVCRVSKLDEEASKWVEITDLGDLVLFLGHFGNVCCSAKELPDGCGVSGNSILFTNEPGDITFTYKYGVHTRDAAYNLWRLSREKLVMIFNTFSVVARSVVCQAQYLALNT